MKKLRATLASLIMLALGACATSVQVSEGGTVLRQTKAIGLLIINEGLVFGVGTAVSVETGSDCMMLVLTPQRVDNFHADMTEWLSLDQVCGTDKETPND